MFILRGRSLHNVFVTSYTSFRLPFLAASSASLVSAFAHSLLSALKLLFTSLFFSLYSILLLSLILTDLVHLTIALWYFRYLSTLYSHPGWPSVHPSEIREELRENIKESWMYKLTPSWLYKHIHIIGEKKSRGQPVSFTDFFGYLVGETILKDVSSTSVHFKICKRLNP